MRIKIRAALAVIVESGVVLVTGTRAERVIAVQFDFVGGARRSWVIRYVPASGSRPNPPEPEVKSFADLGLTTGADLRTPAAAKTLEAALLRALAK